MRNPARNKAYCAVFWIGLVWFSGRNTAYYALFWNICIWNTSDDRKLMHPHFHFEKIGLRWFRLRSGLKSPENSVKIRKSPQTSAKISKMLQHSTKFRKKIFTKSKSAKIRALSTRRRPQPAAAPGPRPRRRRAPPAAPAAPWKRCPRRAAPGPQIEHQKCNVCLSCLHLRLHRSRFVICSSDWQCPT